MIAVEFESAEENKKLLMLYCRCLTTYSCQTPHQRFLPSWFLFAPSMFTHCPPLIIQRDETKKASITLSITALK